MLKKVRKEIITMIEERIAKNEERLDAACASIKNLENALDEFVALKKEIALLNRYYGSKNWFSDKEAYESGKIPKIKAGVLSEDAVWNMNEDIKELMKRMRKVEKENLKK